MKTNPWKEDVYLDRGPVAVEIVTEVRREGAPLKAGVLQTSIFTDANFASGAADSLSGGDHG